MDAVVGERKEEGNAKPRRRKGEHKFIVTRQTFLPKALRLAM